MRAHNFIDLTGQRFGRLVATEYLGKGKWLCKCDCGNTVEVFRGNLKTGNTTSCGCFNKECSSKRAKKHGLSDHKVYTVAINIIDRCTNPKNPAYKYYGGRGVRIYPLWRDNPGEFAKWLLDSGWYEGCEVDKDIKGNPKMPGYFPNTISFVTQTENQRHKRSNIHITYKGKTQLLIDWCRELNLDYKSIYARYHVQGWRDPVDLFEMPVQVGNNQTLRGDKN